ncbi:hypothetical protein CDAR_220141 [Caerostris darwini]|uniref:Uncharacterized protein n=1 Tax=Caerostris darwini TaxID=1538125 RepID=A0AAV4VH67_9ARAC|nr:hypothetical protein CDAR_220141 [Caerostris darwini]
MDFASLSQDDDDFHQKNKTQKIPTGARKKNQNKTEQKNQRDVSDDSPTCTTPKRRPDGRVYVVVKKNNRLSSCTRGRAYKLQSLAPFGFSFTYIKRSASPSPKDEVALKIDRRLAVA